MAGSSYSNKLVETYNSFSGCDVTATINLDIGGTHKTYVVGQMQTITISSYQDKHPVRNLGNHNPVGFVHGKRTIAGTMIFTTLNKDLSVEITKDYKEAFGQNVTLLMDDLPPFDITLSYANEYGHRAAEIIKGVSIISDGKTISINDIYTESQYQYVAVSRDVLVKVGDFNPVPLWNDKNVMGFNFPMFKKEFAKITDVEDVKITYTVEKRSANGTASIVTFNANVDITGEFGIIKADSPKLLRSGEFKTGMSIPMNTAGLHYINIKGQFKVGDSYKTIDKKMAFHIEDKPFRD